MTRLYQGQSVAEWKQIFEEVKAERLANIRGDRYLQVSTGGKFFTRKVRSREDIEADFGQCLQALCALDPATYGAPTATVHSCFSGWQPK